MQPHIQFATAASTRSKHPAHRRKRKFCHPSRPPHLKVFEGRTAPTPSARRSGVGRAGDEPAPRKFPKAAAAGSAQRLAPRLRAPRCAVRARCGLQAQRCAAAGLPQG